MIEEIKQILKSNGEELKSHGEQLKSHGEQLKSHGEQLKSHGEQLKSHGEQLKSHGEQLDIIATKVLEHDGRLDKITRILVEHTERFESIGRNMATKDDVNKITNTLDKIVNLFEVKDQETLLISRGLKTLEIKVEEHDNDIKRIKPALGLS